MADFPIPRGPLTTWNPTTPSITFAKDSVRADSSRSLPCRREGVPSFWVTSVRPRGLRLNRSGPPSNHCVTRGRSFSNPESAAIAIGRRLLEELGDESGEPLGDVEVGLIGQRRHDCEVAVIRVHFIPRLGEGRSSHQHVIEGHPQRVEVGAGVDWRGRQPPGQLWCSVGRIPFGPIAAQWGCEKRGRLSEVDDPDGFGVGVPDDIVGIQIAVQETWPREMAASELTIFGASE